VVRAMQARIPKAGLRLDRLSRRHSRCDQGIARGEAESVANRALAYLNRGSQPSVPDRITIRRKSRISRVASACRRTVGRLAKQGRV